MDITPFLLSFKLAFVSNLLLLLIAIPIAIWLSSGKSILRAITESIVSMPLVLPPTVIGFYFLTAFGPEAIIGKWLIEQFNFQLLFRFEGLVIGSMIYSLPFMIHPIHAALRQLPPQLKEASYTLGKSSYTTYTRVLLPCIKKSIIGAFLISFAHTIGEFGIVLMIGGNIPNETRLASIAIYDEVEAMNYTVANQYALSLTAISFVFLLALYISNQGYFKFLKR